MSCPCPAAARDVREPGIRVVTGGVVAGDLFVILTDGLTEVFDRHDQEFGLDRIKALLRARNGPARWAAGRDSRRGETPRTPAGRSDHPSGQGPARVGV